MVIGGHAFKGYDAALKEIIAELTAMAWQVDDLLAMLEQAIGQPPQDSEAAKSKDKGINRLEYEIIDRLHFILQRYTPSFQELLVLTSLNKVAASLERVGDLAKRCIRSRTKLTQGFSPEHTLEVCALLELTRSMLRAALDNLGEYKPERAAEVVRKERQANEASAALRYAILQSAAESGARADLPNENRKMNIIRDIERIGEHAMDILRMAYFAHTGERFKRKKALESEETAK